MYVFSKQTGEFLTKTSMGNVLILYPADQYFATADDTLLTKVPPHFLRFSAHENRLVPLGPDVLGKTYDELSGLVWDEATQSLVDPTLQYMDQLKAERGYVLQRQNSYPDISDQLDAVFKLAKHLADSGMEMPPDVLSWIHDCQQVKDQYPAK